jgi:hypothetical protein
MPSKRVLLKLQETLLKAVLLGHPLPGNTQPVRFPDLAFVVRQPAVFLLDSNLSGPILIKESPRAIRILSTEALLQESQKHGEITYLQFQAPEVMDDAVRLTLEARIATRDPNQQKLGLSNIHVKFSKIADEWKVLEEPVYSAA